MWRVSVHQLSSLVKAKSHTKVYRVVHVTKTNKGFQNKDNVDKLFVKELQTIYYGIQIINSFPFFVLLFLKEQKCWITKSLRRMFSTKESNLTKPGFLLDFQSFSMYLLLFRSGREVSRQFSPFLPPIGDFWQFLR